MQSRWLGWMRLVDGQRAELCRARLAEAGARMAFDDAPLDLAINAAAQPVVGAVALDPRGCRPDAHGSGQFLATFWAVPSER
ncbi:MAG: hypothetical protein OJF49_002195 [Ktedonobacterales bacterium]|nr:MAG: hypothetical protein OJF49_002195 [Ktedonobacterales bacterium]